MDPKTPRSLGDIEESEPERDPRGRSVPVKKPLEQFLLEFEARLRDHPGESATSAPAALEGRAEGGWRTPVESGERRGRRLPRPGTGRTATPAAFGDLPATVAAATPDLPAPVPPSPAPVPPSPAPMPPAIAVEPEPVASPTEIAPVEARAVTASPAEGAEATSAKKRNRRHRRHRHR